MVKKRRSKAKYSYFIVHFDPLAANTCTASKGEATRTCQGVLLALKLVNLYLVVLLLTDRFCSSLNFVVLQGGMEILHFSGFFFSGYSLVLIDKRVK